MDRAHRLGQTRQVTVYRLITRGTIDERIVQLARVKKDVRFLCVSQQTSSHISTLNRFKISLSVTRISLMSQNQVKLSSCYSTRTSWRISKAAFRTRPQANVQHSQTETETRCVTSGPKRGTNFSDIPMPHQMDLQSKPRMTNRHRSQPLCVARSGGLTGEAPVAGEDGAGAGVASRNRLVPSHRLKRGQCFPYSLAFSVDRTVACFAL